MSNEKREYPYQGWVLRPSYKPVEVTLTGPNVTYSTVDYGDITDSGKRYAREEIFASKTAAIFKGWERIKAQEAKQKKLQDGIDKRKAALIKAA